MAGHVDDLVQRKHHFAIVDEVDSVLIDDARTPLIISGPTPKGDEHEFHILKPRIEKVVQAQKQYVQNCLLEAKQNLTVIQDGSGDKNEVKKKLEDGGIALLRAFRGLPKNKALIKYLSEPGIKVHLQKTENFYMQEQGKHMKKIDIELFFTIDEKNNSIQLTDKGIDLVSGNEERDFFIMPDIGAEIAKLEKEALKPEALLEKKDSLIRDYSIKSERIHSINQLLKAYTLFEKEVEYVVMDNKVKIVDESTGRILDGRRYSDGLHQAIEAKEEVTVEAATQTYATVSLQNYFRMYHKLSGMTGTAETEAGEFWEIYKLDVVAIPTNKPIARNDKNDLVYKTNREKYNAIIEEVTKLSKEGRPVLVGTTSVEISELLSKVLNRGGIKHNVLNAKMHQKEADIVSYAGKESSVTIATNMAGRGTDIILGGNSDYMAKLKIKELLSSRLIKPEEGHKPPIPLQRTNESVGFQTTDKKQKQNFTQNSLNKLFPVTLSDDTDKQLANVISDLVKSWGDRTLTSIELDDRIATAAEKSPTKDENIISLRKAINLIKEEYQDVIKDEEENVRNFGGLHVIGTERHESRRVDNQLRGRAGRQGDFGSTRFFLSLEDNLLRIFGGDRVASLMNAFRVEEDMPIESGMLTRSLEGAQKKVETYYYDIRKQIFEYDEVMNNQRKAVYTERKRVLEGKELKLQVLGYGERTMEEIVEAYINEDLPPEEWDLDKLVSKVKEFIHLLEDLKPNQLFTLNVEELKNYLKEELRNAYDLKEAQIEDSHPGMMREAERFFILQQLDTLWREHLQSMDSLRESVGLRGYGQKDPLIEYKNEGYDMFLEMMINMRRNVIYSMFMFQPAQKST